MEPAMDRVRLPLTNRLWCRSHLVGWWRDHSAARQGLPYPDLAPRLDEPGSDVRFSAINITFSRIR